MANMKTPGEMIAKKLRAAHALINEAEWLLKKFSPDLKEDAKPAKEPAAKAEEEFSLPPGHDPEQPELFPTHDPIKIKKGAKFQRVTKDGKVVSRRRVTDPKATKKEAFDALPKARIKNGLIPVLDLNHVFGFTGHTSEFVNRHMALGHLEAVRQGDKILGITPKEAKRFVRWFYVDRNNAANGQGGAK